MRNSLSPLSLIGLPILGHTLGLLSWARAPFGLRKPL